MWTINVNPEEVRAEVVESAAQKIAESFSEGSFPNLESRVTELIDTAIIKHCDETVAPIIEQGIQEHVIQLTNGYGEVKGEPKTFTEYLVGIADNYLNQKVDWNGKELSPQSYDYNKGNPRLIYLINEHLHFRVEEAIKAAIKEINTAIAPALAETVKSETARVVAEITKARR